MRRLPSPLQRRLLETAQLAAAHLRQRLSSPLGSRRRATVLLAAAGLGLRPPNSPESKPWDPAQWTLLLCPMRRQPAWPRLVLTSRQHRTAGRRLMPRLPLRRQILLLGRQPLLLQVLSLRLLLRQGPLLQCQRQLQRLPCPLLLSKLPAEPRRARATRHPLGSARPRSLLLCRQMGKLCWTHRHLRPHQRTQAVRSLLPRQLLGNLQVSCMPPQTVLMHHAAAPCMLLCHETTWY